MGPLGRLEILQVEVSKGHLYQFMGVFMGPPLEFLKPIFIFTDSHTCFITAVCFSKPHFHILERPFILSLHRIYFCGVGYFSRDDFFLEQAVEGSLSSVSAFSLITASMYSL
jgi:hypothetical protein